MRMSSGDPSSGVDQDVGAACGAGGRGERRPVEHRKLLAGEHQPHRPGRVLHRDPPRLDRLVGVGRPEHQHVRHRPQAGELLDRLMRRAVFADRDAVVGPDVDHVRRAQRGQPDARAHVIGEREEGRAERHHAAVMRHPGEDRGHRVLADPEVDVPSRVSPHAAGRPLRRRRLPSSGTSAL